MCFLGLSSPMRLSVSLLFAAVKSSVAGVHNQVQHRINQQHWHFAMVAELQRKNLSGLSAPYL